MVGKASMRGRQGCELPKHICIPPSPYYSCCHHRPLAPSYFSPRSVVQSRFDPHTSRQTNLDMAGFCWLLGHWRSDSSPYYNRGHFLPALPGINTTSWTIGSTLLALGLSVGQAMGMVICAAVIIAFLAVGAGWMGSHQHLGFTVVSRRFIWRRNCPISTI